MPIAVILNGLLLAATFPCSLALGISHPAVTVLLGLHAGIHFFAALYSFHALCSALKKLPFSVITYPAVYFTVLLIGLIAALPVTAPDALVHHLAVPKWWLASGSPAPIAWHEWSYYPMLLDLPYALFLNFGFEMGASLYHGCYLIVLLGCLLELGSDEEEMPRTGALAALLLLTTPVALKLASIPLVDLGLACYCFLAIRFGAVARPCNRSLALAGAAIGLALSTKYNALLAAPVIIAACALTGLRAGEGIMRAARGAVIVSLVAAVVWSPWPARNATLTGNPLYPLYKSVFGGSSPNSDASTVKAPGPLMHRILVYGESPAEVALLPLRVFIDGADGSPRRFDGLLSPLLLFALLVPFNPRIRARAFPYLFFAAVYLPLALVYSIARVRYLIPIAPPLAFAAALAIDGIRERAPRLRFAIPAALFAQIAVCFVYLGSVAFSDTTRKYLQDQTPKAAFLESKLDDYGIIEQVNSLLSDSDRVYLLLTPNHFYYFDRPVYSAGHFSGAQVLSWLRTEADPDSLSEHFDSLNATHLMVHTRRTRDLITELEPHQIAAWDAFVANHLELVSNEGGYSLWRLKRA